LWFDKRKATAGRSASLRMTEFLAGLIATEMIGINKWQT
jgi:hypothetical protein